MQWGSVVDATPSKPTSRLAAGFEGFLFAKISDDRGGEPLSIVSALARLDIDPWAEAAALAAMPADAAAQRLAVVLGQLPGASLAAGASARAAPGLIALLPKPALGPRTRLAAGANDVRGGRIVGLFLVLFLAAVAAGTLAIHPNTPTTAPVTAALAVPNPAPARTAGP